MLVLLNVYNFSIIFFIALLWILFLPINNPTYYFSLGHYWKEIFIVNIMTFFILQVNFF